MNGSFQQWLQTCAAAPGMVGCGLRQPDGRLYLPRHRGGLSGGNDGDNPRQFEDLRIAGFMPDLVPRWTTWAFEQCRVRFIERPDGWLLGLVVRPGSAAAASFDLLSREFLSFQPES